MLKRLGCAVLAVGLLSSPASAGPAGDMLKQALYSGALADGLAQLSSLAATDTEAAFGVGVITLAQAVEGVAQTLWRHGFELPNTDSAFGRGARLPMPVNPSPEPFDYAGVRQMLQDLVTGLDDAYGYFDMAGASGDYVVEINPLMVRIDANGDGRSDPGESLGGIFAMWNGTSLGNVLAPPLPNDPPWFESFGFDRADAYWLAGYTQVMAAQADFLLAHDFSGFVNAIFHRLFPRAGFPMQDYANGGMLMLDPQTDTGIADIIAGIHTISWPVTDRTRLAGVRERMKAVLAHSRLNWDAILAETDDNRELVPSPRQTAIVPDMAVTDERVAAWRETLDQAEKVLDGGLLVPHWRFRQGFDLKAYFEGATRTDLVMILSGLDAVPFLRDGPIASQADFRAIQDAFGSEWLGYAFWFN